MRKKIYLYKHLSIKRFNNYRDDFYNRYTYDIERLLEFKIIINKLLEEKIFHYSLLNNSVNELVNLQKITKSHQLLLLNFSKNSNKKSLLIHKKLDLINLSSFLLGYSAFLELMKILHEKKEEEINNLIREIIEKDKNVNLENESLIRLRDEWRNCLPPELLDVNSNPINNLSIRDKINLEIYKLLIDFL